MGATDSSETLVATHRITWRHTPEERSVKYVDITNGFGTENVVITHTISSNSIQWRWQNARIWTRVRVRVRARVTLRLAVYRQTTSPLRLTTDNFFLLNTWFHSPYVASSLTRGWVCRLQLLLALASAVILGSASCGTWHFTASDLRLPQTWRARSPYLYLPGTGWPSYTPRHWAPFSSPPTTRRATVEVFDRASTRVFEQQVLGRTNRLLSLIWHGPHRKRHVQQFCYCCRGKIFTEMLPSNDRGYTDRHTG
jgi:hypothetical protein